MSQFPMISALPAPDAAPQAGKTIVQEIPQTLGAIECVQLKPTSAAEVWTDQIESVEVRRGLELVREYTTASLANEVNLNGKMRGQALQGTGSLVTIWFAKPWLRSKDAVAASVYDTRNATERLTIKVKFKAGAVNVGLSGYVVTWPNRSGVNGWVEKTSRGSLKITQAGENSTEITVNEAIRRITLEGDNITHVRVRIGGRDLIEEIAVADLIDIYERHGLDVPANTVPIVFDLRFMAGDLFPVSFGDLPAGLMRVIVTTGTTAGVDYSMETVTAAAA